jgi:hypothetical protein
MRAYHTLKYFLDIHVRVCTGRIDWKNSILRITPMIGGQLRLAVQPLFCPHPGHTLVQWLNRPDLRIYSVLRISAGLVKASFSV